jgi:SAM-dependent methyltransferase
MDKCLCSGVEAEPFFHNAFKVLPNGELAPGVGEFIQCTSCGLVRPASPPFKTEAEYISYYTAYPPTKTEYVIKDWEHDLDVAKQRMSRCKLEYTDVLRVLDVGCGSGAFVYACRARGYTAFGCEIASYSYSECKPSWVHRVRLENLTFPPGYFDVVTFFDVLEHVMDPIKMLREIVAISRYAGRCIIEIPRFFHPSGQHHWKDDEHLWYWDTNQMLRQLFKIGLLVDSVMNPIESKTMFRCINIARGIDV